MSKDTETTTTQAPVINLVPRPRKISDGNNDFLLNLAGQNNNEWTAHLPVGTTREDVLNPAFWTHVAKRLRSMDKIDAWSKDGEFYARYIVVYADPHSAKLKELEFHVIGKIEVSAKESGYYAEYIAPSVRWCVFRTSDNERVKTHLYDEIAAKAWIVENMKSVAS